jgi:hypothetical protein
MGGKYTANVIGDGRGLRKYMVKVGNRSFDDKKCHLMSYSNYHGLLGNPSAVVCLWYASASCGGRIRGVGFLWALIKVEITKQVKLPGIVFPHFLL